MTAPSESQIAALTDALYADAELGPGYMLRDDCEHLARRVLASDWLAERDAEQRREAIEEAADAVEAHKGMTAAHPTWLRAYAAETYPSKETDR